MPPRGLYISACRRKGAEAYSTPYMRLIYASQPCTKNARTCRRQGRALRVGRETSATPMCSVAAVNSAGRGRRLTRKPVTESNLILRAPAQRAAVGRTAAFTGAAEEEAQIWAFCAPMSLGSPGELVQAVGSCVPVHPGTAAVEQDRSARAGSGCPADCGRQRDQDDLGALAAYAQDPVAVFLAEVGNVGAGDLEDPQAEHGHQGEAARVR
jgi:hypothetical protein